MDLLVDPFGGHWGDLCDAALLAEDVGVDGIWLYDHLAGSVHGATHVLECWTILSALAGAIPRLQLGSLVLNVANRDAGTLAVMASTLQEVSGGRLLLGVGAGGGRATPYAAGRSQSAAPSPTTRHGGRRWRRPSPHCDRSGRDRPVAPPASCAPSHPRR
jgi:alkanesulfonate monooxygenase SsuD/methylene tetrahydromethanopterin reductase-like flavin-dependent oxidoreductase (luciferase family)